MLVTFFPDKSYICSFFCGLICNVIDSCCREIICLRGKYRTTSEAINKSTIIAIKLLTQSTKAAKGE